MGTSDSSYPVQGTGGIPTNLNIAGQTSGDILYYDGTKWVRDAIGTANQLLHGGLTPTYSAVVDGDVSATAAIAKSKISTASTWVLADLPTGTGILKGTGGAPAYVTPLLKADIPTTTVFTDQTNIFGAFLQKFQAGTNFSLVDPTDTTKIAQFVLSGITTLTTRSYTLPNTSDTLAVLGFAQTFTALQTFGNNISIGGVTFNIAAIASGQFIKYNGTNWINYTRVAADVTTELGYTPANRAGDALSGTFTGTPSLSGTIAFTNISPFSIANGQTLTFSVTAQTIGAATLTIPNFAGVADTFAFITLAQTLSNKTIASPVFSGTATGTYTLGGTPSMTLAVSRPITISGGLGAAEFGSESGFSDVFTGFGTRSTVGGAGTISSFEIARDSGGLNNYAFLVITPIPGTVNAEFLILGRGVNQTVDYELTVRKIGTGSLRALDVYMGATKLMSFDTANTITSYVSMLLQAKITQYNNINTTGLGIPATYASYSTTANTAAVTNAINYIPPATAGRYRICGIVNVTAWTTPASFTVVVTYTDDSGTARTETLAVTRGSTGAVAAAITAVDRWYFILPLFAINNGAVAITVSTSGTFTGSPTYNLSATLEQLA